MASSPVLAQRPVSSKSSDKREEETPSLTDKKGKEQDKKDVQWVDSLEDACDSYNPTREERQNDVTGLEQRKEGGRLYKHPACDVCAELDGPMFKRKRHTRSWPFRGLLTGHPGSATPSSKGQGWQEKRVDLRPTEQPRGRRGRLFCPIVAFEDRPEAEDTQDSDIDL